MPTSEFAPPVSHPRLFLAPSQIAGLRAQVETDDVSRRLFRCVLQVADKFLDEPVCERELEGVRLLGVSRAVLSRTLYLGIAALLTEDPRYAGRAILELIAAANFSDWNPAHYLDVGEMTMALAIGYDWLHEQLSEAEKGLIADAIIEKGLRPSYLSPKYNWWIDSPNNWNQVCHAGLTAGALAVYERDPELAQAVISRAIAKVPLTGAAYAPDGAYAEGPMYWGYGTSFHVMLIGMLESALGYDGGLSSLPGFLASARYIQQMTGPSGDFFNYSDSRARRSMEAPLFWIARRLDAPEMLRVDLRTLDRTLASVPMAPAREASRLLPLILLWWQPDFANRLTDKSEPEARHWMGRGEVSVGIHRSAWDDPHAGFVAIKAGCAGAPHGHMDGGAFVLEAGGVRWAVDPGMQDYQSLEKFGLSLWSREPESDRWQIFRIGAEAHNILRFNGQPQLIQGATSIVRFGADGDWPHTVVDLSGIYADQATRVWRGVALGKSGSFVLQDEWTVRADAEVTWQFLTHARVVIEGSSIHLSQGGLDFWMHVVAPAAAVLDVQDVSQPANYYDAANPGLSRITVRMSTMGGDDGKLLISGALGHIPEAGTGPADLLADWSKPLSH